MSKIHDLKEAFVEHGYDTKGRASVSDDWLQT